MSSSPPQSSQGSSTTIPGPRERIKSSWRRTVTKTEKCHICFVLQRLLIGRRASDVTLEADDSTQGRTFKAEISRQHVSIPRFTAPKNHVLPKWRVMALRASGQRV